MYLKIRKNIISLAIVAVASILIWKLFIRETNLKALNYYLHLPTPNGVYLYETESSQEFLEFEPYKVHTVRRYFVKEGETIAEFGKTFNESFEIQYLGNYSPIGGCVHDTWNEFFGANDVYEHTFTKELELNVWSGNNPKIILYHKGDNSCSLVKANFNTGGLTKDNDIIKLEEHLFLYDETTNELHRLKMFNSAETLMHEYCIERTYKPLSAEDCLKYMR